MRSTHICIVGTGLASQTLAAALTPSPHRVTLVQPKEPSQYYGGVWLPQSTLLSLAQIGVTPSTRASKQLEQVTHPGRVSRHRNAPGGSLKVEALVQSLQSTAQLDQTLIEPIQAIHRRATSLELELKSETLTVDYLIAADGTDSTTRIQLFPSSSPKDTGLWVHRTLTDFHTGLCEPHLFRDGDTSIELLPLRGGLSALTLICPSEDPKDAKRLFGPIPAVIASLSSDSWHTTPLKLLPEITLGNERVACVGDAAHGPTHNPNLGAQLAIEDALFLAQCLVGGSTNRYREHRLSELEIILRSQKPRFPKNLIGLRALPTQLMSTLFGQ